MTFCDKLFFDILTISDTVTEYYENFHQIQHEPLGSNTYLRHKSLHSTPKTFEAVAKRLLNLNLSI